MTLPALASPAVALSDESYHLLNELLEERFGLHFPAHRRAILEDRLQPRLRALSLGNFLEYYAYLRANGNGESRELAKAVTNNETYFFRERDQLDALFGEAVGTLRHSGRILCAGCSSGEEAFTLSFFSHDAAAGAPAAASVRIDAFDLDLERLAVAQKGECRARSLRMMTEPQIARFLEPLGEGRWKVREQYRKPVTFMPGNLVDPAMFRTAGPYDAVFCRNVLIYFSRGAMKRAVENLASVLRPGGLLFLGHSESAIGLLPQLETVRLGKCIVYRKAGA